MVGVGVRRQGEAAVAGGCCAGWHTCGMSRGRVETRYVEYVVDPGLERRSLFESLARDHPGLETVLYLGSSIHVTPSFYFRHVVYVDRGDQAARFFADVEMVDALVADRGHHRRAPYVHFIHQDFTMPLALREASFDLALALYAPGASAAAARYLRYGGLLVTDNHRGDASSALSDDRLALVAVGTTESRRVRFSSEDLESHIVNVEQPEPHRRKPDYFKFEKQRIRTAH